VEDLGLAWKVLRHDSGLRARNRFKMTLVKKTLNRFNLTILVFESVLFLLNHLRCNIFSLIKYKDGSNICVNAHTRTVLFRTPRNKIDLWGEKQEPDESLISRPYISRVTQLNHSCSISQKTPRFPSNKTKAASMKAEPAHGKMMISALPNVNMILGTIIASGSPDASFLKYKQSKSKWIRFAND
jgi:hypothetical protein